MRTMFLTTCLSFLAAAEPLAGPPPRQFVLSAIPVAPADVQKDLATCKVSLAAAIETAVGATGGTARSAEILVQNGKPSVRVWIYRDNQCKRVEVDGESGAIVATFDIPRFPGDPVEGAWTETSSGLRYYDVQVGTGAKPKDPMTKVKVHYTGWLVDGLKFESSRDRGEPYVTALNKVITGWTEGISTMQAGGKRKLIIPAGLGYGAKGSRVVPPNAVLVFDIELLEVLN